jgi:NAD(P)-dependent dehydrogenase (short-subunit alcohol dehydrogenase family)
MTGRLAGKIALITGTGGGQGRAAARLFAAEGAHIVGCDINSEAGAETTKLVRDAGGQMITRTVDLGDENQVRAWIELAVSEWGDFDILYNNASAPKYGKTTEFSTEDWRFVIRNELDLVFWATKYAHPVLARRGGGSIINTASTAGVTGLSLNGKLHQFAHSMAKGGVISMSRFWASEFAPDNIRVNSVSPGLIETPGLRLVDPQIRQSIVGDFISAQLIKRVGVPEDIAHCALYLASDESSFCTGQNFCIDGGFSAI